MSVTFAPDLYPLPDWVPVLNVSNLNAKLLLDRLGLDSDSTSWGGSCAAEDFLGRAMVANVGREDSGAPAATEGRFTDCGMRPGYFEDRLQELTEIALAAQKLKVEVSWF